MKISVILMLASGFLFLNYPGNSQSEIPFTAEELLGKAIQFHDPEGKWDHYAGSVKLTDSNPTGNTYGTEIIEIDVGKDYYSWTRRAGGTVVSRGMKDGKIFYSLNGNSNLSEEQIKQFGCDKATIEMMKTWHFFHFGKLEYLRQAGLELQKEVNQTVFMDKPCYEIMFIGDENKVIHPMWKGKMIFRLDKSNFQITGALLHFNNQWYKEMFEGVLEINGLKLPRVRIYQSDEDKTQLWVDFFVRADDQYSLPDNYQNKSMVTNSCIGFKSVHLLKLENEEALNKLRQPLKEINEALAEMGYPECGYVIYKVGEDNKADYTHIMEGWWLSKEVYDETHNHPEYKALTEKYNTLFESVLTGQNYFRINKMIPEL